MTSALIAGHGARPRAIGAAVGGRRLPKDCGHRVIITFSVVCPSPVLSTGLTSLLFVATILDALRPILIAIRNGEGVDHF
jgi:hypothetical protein